MNEARKNSVKQLADLYTVIIGISLTVAIYNAVDPTAPLVPVHINYLTNLFTFLVLIIPFYHGAVRHLYASYVECDEAANWKNSALLADFVLLFVEGCIFLILAGVLGQTVKLAWSIIGLLIFDSVWGYLAWLAFTRSTGQSVEAKWALINILTAALLIVILVFSNASFENAPRLAQFGLFTIITVRTILDYIFSWSFLFPAADAPGIGKLGNK